MVEVVGRGDVHDVDARVGEHRLVALVRLRQRVGARLLAHALGRGADDAGDLHPQPPQGLDMDQADEPGPHDRRPYLAGVRHAVLPSSWWGTNANARAGLSSKIARARSSPSSRARRGRKRAKT